MNLDERLRLLESVILNATDAVLITDAEPIDLPGPVIVYVNPAFTRMTGYTPDEVIGKSPRILQGPDSSAETRAEILTSLRAWKPVEAELLNYRKDGSTFWVELSISLVTDETGWHTHWISIQRDVTERHTKLEAYRQLEVARVQNAALTNEVKEKEAIQDQLTYVAFHDSLTDLHNRSFFLATLQSALLRVKTTTNSDQSFVLYLDLDGFKNVNDTLGHRVGDQLLIETSQRLKTCARVSDTLARIGGDEFTLLLEHLSGLHEAQEIADRLLQATQAELLVDSSVLQIAPSIGICHIHAGYADAEEILRDADLAMYVAKRAGGGRWTIFGQEMHEEALTELQRKIQLRTAVGRQEFELFYQPLVDTLEGRITGVEALIRWRHPTKGLLSPYEFIGLAEDTGLIVPIGRWVMRQACLDVLYLNRTLGDELCLSVNVSSRQLEETEFFRELSTVLCTTGFTPSQLQLEITESVFLKDAKRIGSLFQQIRSLGVTIAFDDFGTGYSSLSYLEHYPIDRLKIDQSFVQNMSENAVRASIVKMIIQLAREIGLSVSAEGIETEEQATLLQACGCHLLQGYLYGKPLPLPEVAVLLRAGVRSEG